MKDTHQNRVAGVGTAIGAVIFGAFMASCAPGKLPCDKDDQWKAVCDEPETAQGGSGGGGGGQGGAPGTGGGTPGSGGGGGGPVNANTPVPNCTAYPTLGKMDDFFAMRCGVDGACHTTPGAAVWKDLKMPGIWDRMRTVNATVDCGGSKMINTKDWDKSVLWVITREPKAACPEAGTIIRSMPPQEMATPKLPPLTAEESTCLENYLKALVAP